MRVLTRLILSFYNSSGFQSICLVVIEVSSAPICFSGMRVTLANLNVTPTADELVIAASETACGSGDLLTRARICTPVSSRLSSEAQSRNRRGNRFLFILMSWQPKSGEDKTNTQSAQRMSAVLPDRACRRYGLFSCGRAGRDQAPENSAEGDPVWTPRPHTSQATARYFFSLSLWPQRDKR